MPVEMLFGSGKNNNYLSMWSKMGAEEGSGYIKFPNGTLIAWVSQDFTGNVNTSWGSSYYSPQITLPNWPADFHATPDNVQVSVNGTGGGDVWLGKVSGTSKTTAGKVYAYGPVAQSNISFTVKAVAFGRWKA